MEYAVVALPAAPLRRKANHRSEMVSQLLFGETVRVLKEKGALWVKVRSLHDAYEGWMTNTLLQEVDKTMAETKSTDVTADLMGLISVGEKTIHIPVGSSLPAFMEYSFSGNIIKRNEQTPTAELIRQLTSAWLNAPYLWGGRTPLGVDCSGFVQVIFKLMGIDLPRDAWQQAQEGKPVNKFSDTRAGDLAFFNNKEEIVHVGILLGDGKIIHASGKVRIDTITKKGIVNDETGEKGLKLRAVRRVF